MTVSNNWPDLLNVAFRKIYDQVYADHMEEFSKVFDIMTSDRAYEKFSSATGFGMARDVSEGEQIPTDDPAQGKSSYPCNKYSLTNGGSLRYNI